MFETWSNFLLPVTGAGCVLVFIQSMDAPVEYQPSLPASGVFLRRREQHQSGRVWGFLVPVICVMRYRLVRWEQVPGIQERLRDLELVLIRAGWPLGLCGPELVSALILLMLSLLWISEMVNLCVTTSLSLPVAALASGLVILFGLTWLQEMRTNRIQAIRVGLPYVLDMLTLALGAGLDFVQAVHHVLTQRLETDPLNEELAIFAQEVALGMTRKDALLHLQHRIDLPEVTELVSGILQAEQMGTPLVQILRLQAEALRLSRDQRAENHAAKASVKMLMPMILIMGSVMLTVMGPIVVRLIRQMAQ